MTGARSFSAHEIAQACGVTARGIRKRATTEGWKYETLPVKGGVQLRYLFDQLPIDIKEAVTRSAINSAIAVMQEGQLPAPGMAKSAVTTALTVIQGGHGVTRAAQTGDLGAVEATAADRQRRLAREVVLRTLRELVAAGAGSMNAASAILVERARGGQLPPATLNVLKQACDERGQRGHDADSLPTARTLRYWASQARAGQDLTPRPSAVVDLRVRSWYIPFFALTDRPQKPTLRWAHEQLVANWRPEWSDPPGSEPPSYDQAVRAYKKRSKGDALKGRHTGSALRALSFYQHRTYNDLAPFAEVHADGWNTHFTAPHPKTGEYVTYEVWHFHDVATRYVTPFAIGLTENTDLILEGLQACIRVGGIPAIWQTDHTGSVKNDRVMEPDSGLADRLGISVVHPAKVGNSQANGIAENFNTWLDREARELGTYQHPQRMDSATFVRTRRITNAMVRAAGNPAERARLRQQAIRQAKGIVFDSHAEAVAWLREREDRWNNHPHRELPKHRDPATGRLVHMSPKQSLDAAIAAGWEPVALSEADLIDQFRPHLKKKVRRGTVTPYGGMRYRNSALDEHEGETVLVAVDPEAPEYAWVKDLKGRLLCTAAFVEATGSRTESMREHSERKRAEAQIRLREQQIDLIEQRIAPPALEMGSGFQALSRDSLSTHLRRANSYVDDTADEVAEKRTERGFKEFVEHAKEHPEEVDPMEVYLRRRMKENKAAEEQAIADELAQIEAAMRKAADEAASGGDDNEGSERAAG